MKRELDQTLLTPMDYALYTLLWSIPVVGWICWIGACFSSVRNKRNFAWAFLVVVILSLIGVYIALSLFSGLRSVLGF